MACRGITPVIFHPIMFKTVFSPALIIFSGTLYAITFGVNSYFLDSFAHSLGVSWIFLPAGLRLLLTLLFAESGAIGIALASVIISICFFFENLVLGIPAGITSGLAPYVARYLAFKDMGLNAQLDTLDGSKLLSCVLIYSLICPLMHQIVFTIATLDNLFFDNLGVMIIGDLVGTVIVIYSAKLLIYFFKRKQKQLSVK